MNISQIANGAYWTIIASLALSKNIRFEDVVQLDSSKSPIRWVSNQTLTTLPTIDSTKAAVITLMGAAAFIVYAYQAISNIKKEYEEVSVKNKQS